MTTSALLLAPPSGIISQGGGASTPPFHIEKTRTAGDVAESAVAWTDVDGAGGLDLVIPNVSVNDWIEATVCAMGSVVSGSAAALDFFTMNGSTPVNQFGTNANGIPGARQTNLGIATTDIGLNGKWRRKLVSGDIISGSCTLRLRYIGFGSHLNTLYANANCPLAVQATYLGP